MQELYIQIDYLKALTVCKKQSGTLPPFGEWMDEEICNQINRLEYFKPSYWVQVPNTTERAEDETGIVAKLKENYFKGYEFSAEVYYAKLPEGEPFLRFCKQIILSHEFRNKTDEEQSEILDRCAESIVEQAPVTKRLQEEIRKLVESPAAKEPIKDRKSAEKYGTLMQEICANVALNKVNGLHRAREFAKDYGANVIAYELLQNANDCRVRSGYEASLPGEMELDLDIAIRENEVKLFYKEKGFSPIDLLAVCTRENTGNREQTEATGHKGTGFKAVYNRFDRVKIVSNYFEATFDKNSHPEYTMTSDHKKIKIDNETAVQDGTITSDYPIPFFEFSDTYSGKTEITLFSEKSVEDVLTQFAEMESYLFLNTLGMIRITDYREFPAKITNIQKELTENALIIKKDGKDIKFYYYEQQLSENGSVLEGKRLLKKNKIQVLFPQSKSEEVKHKYYCDLPMTGMDERYRNHRFIVNLRDVEPTDDRKEYNVGGSSGAEDVAKFNQEIEQLEKAAFAKIFERFAEEHSTKAYLYFPGLLRYSELTVVPFIQTKVSEASEIVLKSLADPKVLLPDYAYWWFQVEEKPEELKNPYAMAEQPSYIYYDEPVKIGETPKWIEILNQNYIMSSNRSDNRFGEYFGELLLKSGRKELPESVKEYIRVGYNFFSGEIRSAVCAWIITACCSYPKVYKIDGIRLPEFMGEQYCSFGHVRELLREYLQLKEVPSDFEDVCKNALEKCHIPMRADVYTDTEEPSEDVLWKYLKEEGKENAGLREDLYGKAKKELVKCTFEQQKNYFHQGLVVIKIHNCNEYTFLEYSSQYYKADISPCGIRDVWVVDCMQEHFYTYESLCREKQDCEEQERIGKVICSLKEAMGTSGFYLQTQNDELISQILCKNVTEEERELIFAAVTKVLRESESSRKKWLFRVMLEKYRPGKRILWANEYYELIDMYQEYGARNGQLPFRFYFEVDISGISRNQMQIFEERIHQSEKDKELKEWNNETLRDVFRDSVKIYEYSERNHRKYLEAEEKDGKKIIVVFGEDSIHKMLEECFGCNGYMTPRSIHPMTSFPLSKYEPFDDELYETEGADKLAYTEWFNRLVDRNPKTVSQLVNYEGFKEHWKHLLNRFEDDTAGEFTCWRGYGKQKKEELPVCPVCGAKLHAEANSLKTRYVSIHKHDAMPENKVLLPMLLCKNCDDAAVASNAVYLRAECGSIESALCAKQPVLLCFDRYGMEPTEEQCRMSVQHSAVLVRIMRDAQIKKSDTE